MARISLDQSKIAEFGRESHIRRLSLFGSVLGEDFGPDSDVDVLVEFDPEHVPGLEFSGMEIELSEMLGRKEATTLTEVRLVRTWTVIGY